MKLASDIPRELDPVLVDVGAAEGSVTSRFLGMGWSAIAYEPDTANRRRFERNVGRDRKVQLSTAAVSDKPAKSVTLFTSPVSSGVSTLAAFHNSHKATATVDVVTLSEDLRTREVDKVTFLKVDVEDFDFLVLKGFDWHLKPRFVMYEFEDHKTAPLGYSLAESSSYMAMRGYSLVFSVGTQSRNTEHVTVGEDFSLRRLPMFPSAGEMCCASAIPRMRKSICNIRNNDQIHLVPSQP